MDVEDPMDTQVAVVKVIWVQLLFVSGDTDTGRDRVREDVFRKRKKRIVVI